ncbi:MAG: c-type cytochrome, partial [Oscillospiraceae bacterium]|nr:c-type cytochrome [Oscillospiraceae bacterium]
YLRSLTPVQSPHLNRDGTLTASAERGKALFERSGCVSCHTGPNFTDLKMHPSTNSDVTWENRDMKTATLVEVWRTAPYGYNGKFATLREAVEHSQGAGKLNGRQLDDLTDYVASIGGEGEYYGVEQLLSDNKGKQEINYLESGAVLHSISIRKQLASAVPAALRISLHRAAGTVIASEDITLEPMAAGDVANVSFKMTLPEDLAAGDYLLVRVAGGGNQLASDWKVVY